MRTLGIYQSADADDASRALEFMKQNPSGNNSIRAIELLEKAALDKGLWFIEDAETREILAVSGVFKYGKEGEIREAGFTRVILNGYGLQRLLLALRALHERILDPEYDLFVSSAAESNERSVENMLKAGYLPYKYKDDSEQDKLVKNFKEEKSKFATIDKEVKYYILSKGAYRHFAAYLSGLFKNPVLSRPSRQKLGETESVRLDFSGTALWRHSESVKALAEGRLED